MLTSTAARVGLKDIIRFKSLEHLCLRDCTEVDENLLRFIARLPALTRLDLSHCASVDDRLLLSLVSLGKLEYLNLAGYVVKCREMRVRVSRQGGLQEPSALAIHITHSPFP